MTFASASTSLTDVDVATVGRVFLVGCPRSGTTLLQSLLAAHSQVASLPETHFFQNLLNCEEHRRSGDNQPGLMRRLQLVRRRLCLAAGYVSDKRVRRSWGEVPELDAPGVRCTVREHIERFVEGMDARCLAAGRSIWVEKTPDHLYYLEHIHRYVLGARFIHLIRDGEEVVASLYSAGRNYPTWASFLDLDRAAERWNAAVEESLAYAGRPGHLLVRYEALLAQPEQTLKQLMAFVGASYEPQMLEEAGREVAGLVRHDEPWKGSVAGGLRDRRKFEWVFTPEQRAAVTHSLRELDWPRLAMTPGVIAAM